MNKTKNKTKALKNTRNENGFFRALIFGFLTCSVTWIALALVFALVMSRQTDSNALGNVLSPAITVISLAAGGFAAGKTDKSCATLSSFVLGTSVLGICYALTTALGLSKGFGSAMKTLIIVIMLLCPVLGAKLATRQKKNNVRRRKRL